MPDRTGDVPDYERELARLLREVRIDLAETRARHRLGAASADEVGRAFRRMTILAAMERELNAAHQRAVSLNYGKATK